MCQFIPFWANHSDCFSLKDNGRNFIAQSIMTRTSSVFRPSIRSSRQRSWLLQRMICCFHDIMLVSDCSMSFSNSPSLSAGISEKKRTKLTYIICGGHKCKQFLSVLLLYLFSIHCKIFQMFDLPSFSEAALFRLRISFGNSSHLSHNISWSWVHGLWRAAFDESDSAKEMQWSGHLSLSEAWRRKSVFKYNLNAPKSSIILSRLSSSSCLKIKSIKLTVL